MHVSSTRIWSPFVRRFLIQEQIYCFKRNEDAPRAPRAPQRVPPWRAKIRPTLVQTLRPYFEVYCLFHRNEWRRKKGNHTRAHPQCPRPQLANRPSQAQSPHVTQSLLLKDNCSKPKLFGALLFKGNCLKLKIVWGFLRTCWQMEGLALELLHASRGGPPP